jgi:regulator of protease activity HflC (stomatin/prohibitin superfamily)
LVLYLLSRIRIVDQYERAVILRLGKYVATRTPGIYVLLPFLDVATKVDIRTTTRIVKKQEAITSDNVPIKVDAVIQYRVTDPVKACLVVEDADYAVTQVALTNLRIILGKHTLDDVLKGQDAITQEMQANIDKATDPWGIQVERVEIKNVEIPESMQRAMAQEAEALREKRAREIKAQGEVAAAQMLKQAAETIAQSPGGLELRRMQMITEVGAEQNTTTIIMMPAEFVSAAGAIASKLTVA